MAVPFLLQGPSGKFCGPTLKPCFFGFFASGGSPPAMIVSFLPERAGAAGASPSSRLRFFDVIAAANGKFKVYRSVLASSCVHFIVADSKRRNGGLPKNFLGWTFKEGQSHDSAKRFSFMIESPPRLARPHTSQPQ